MEEVFFGIMLHGIIVPEPPGLIAQNARFTAISIPAVEKINRWISDIRSNWFNRFLQEAPIICIYVPNNATFTVQQIFISLREKNNGVTH